MRLKENDTKQRYRHCAAALGCLLFASSVAGGAHADPPNIVLFLADDLGFSDTAPYGSEIPTPSISELAAGGITFANYHTAAVRRQNIPDKRIVFGH